MEDLLRDISDLLVNIRDILCDIRNQNVGVIEKNNALAELHISMRRVELLELERVKNEMLTNKD